MVTITVDPTNPAKVALTATVTLYLDRVLIDTLSKEVETAIRNQAVKDLKTNPAVKKAIADAAVAKLLEMLSIVKTEPIVKEYTDFRGVLELQAKSIDMPMVTTVPILPNGVIVNSRDKI